MKEPTIKRATRRLAASIAIATALAAAQSAQAARYWTGTISTAWDDTGNWKGSSGHFYIQPVAENKMLTTIDNDDCTGYQTHLYCGTEEKPFVFSNSGTFTADTQFDIGYNGNASGAVLFQGGKFNIKTLLIGKEATSEKDASEGYLKLDGTALTVTASANIMNGKLVADNSTFTCKDMNAGHGTNCVVTIEKNSGDWTFSGTPKFGTATGSVVRVYHRGGSMKSADMSVGVSGVPADVYFEISGGVVTNTTSYATICGAVVTVKDGGKLVGTRNNENYGIVVGHGSSDATINIKDGGEVYLPAGGVTLCNDTTSTATINISNDGALTAKKFYVRNNKADNAATINLDGGIIRATADNDSFITAYAKLHIYVGSNGGTFDTAGHAVTIGEDLENKSGATGFVRFAGGGTATLSGAVSYTGVTYVDAGTKLVATTAAEKTNILKNGLEMIGTPTLGTAYTIFTSSVELTEDDLANVKCRMASNPTIALSEDNLSIVVTVDALQAAYWTGSAGDNNLSTPGNWAGNAVPTSGSATILCIVPTTFSVGTTFRPDTLVVPDSSAVVTIGAGDLHLAALTNAYKLAIASGASLTIDGDLVGYAAKNTKPILYSNYGTVTVNGTVRFRSSGTSAGESIVSQYAVADENTAPIIAKGLAYHADGNDYLVANLGSMNNGVGKWVVGANGFTYPNSRLIWHSGFRVDGQDVTLYSSADWTLAETYRHTGNDLYIISTGTVTIDSTDYNDQTTGRTVTLEGYINAQGSADTPLTITGKGTVVLDSKTANNHTNVVNGAIAVTDTATLQINKDVVIGGAGSISLAAGTTLALDSSALGTIGDTEFTPCFPGLALPETGTATLRIDGDRLRSGNYVLLNAVPANYANLAVDCTTAAIAGRKASVVEKNGQLVLNIVPDGLMIIFR